MCMPSTTKQTRAYFRGPLMQATPEWKASARAAMEARGITNTELAKAIGCSKSNLTRLWDPSTSVSRVVEAVSKHLGIQLPVVGVDLDASDIIELVAKLSDDDKERVVDFVRRLAKD